jgi:predicted phosphodiesterase
MTTSNKLSVLTIGDPHFKSKNTDQTIDMTNKILNLIQQQQPDLVVCLGDVLHDHEKIKDTLVLVQAVQFFRDISKLCPLYVIVGNHDRRNNSDFLSDVHPFDACKDMNNVTIVDKPVFTTIKNVDLTLVPYVPPGRFEEALNTMTKFDWSQSGCIFAHQEFKGAKMGAIVSEKGDEWPLSNPLVVSGHIHDYDRPQLNFVYVCTQVQHAFGDSDDKAISIFDFYSSKSIINNDILSSCKLTGNVYWNETRHDLGIIKRCIVRLKCDQVTKWKPPTNRIVKLIITGTPAEIKTIRKLNYITELKKMGVNVQYKATNVQINESLFSSQFNNLSHREQLGRAASEDIQLNRWFQNLFGRVDVKPNPVITLSLNNLSLSHQPQ